MEARGDSGTFSRYYDLDAWWKSQIHKLPEGVQKTFPFMIVPKASKSEKNEGLETLKDTERTPRGNNQGTRVCVDCGKTDNGINLHKTCSGKYEIQTMCFLKKFPPNR